MSEDNISVTFVCPQCGEQLVGPAGNNEAQLSDMLSCPVHGEIGRFEELTEKAGEAVARHVGDQLEQALKNSGLSFTKK